MNPWLIGLLFVCIGLSVTALGSSLTRPVRSAAGDRRLARIERRLTLIMQHLEIEEPDSPMPGVVQELEQGRKINAIKLYREQTGAGLAEAKSAVETIARERGL